MEEEIKRAVSEKEIYEPLGEGELPKEIVSLEERIQNAPKLAPLFIKIDKYRDVLENIQKLKTILNDINNLLKLKKEIEKIRKDSSKTLEKNIRDFIDTTNKLDREFIIPRPMRPYVKTEKTQKIEGFISEMQEELARIKEELNKIR
ncbi:MAG: hypothetical protein ACE5J4_03100 [Candidatus Aenigmatarchaeota archaeon]